MCRNRGLLRESQPSAARLRFIRLGLALTVTLLMAAEVRGQSEMAFPIDSREQVGVAYHRFIRSGEVPMHVEVLGLVRSPGVYEVGQNTDLGTMLALAGGTSEGLRSNGELVKLTVDVYRNDAGGRTLIFTQSMDSMFVASRPHPTLREGDVINVHGVVERKFSWRDTLSIATSAAALALFVERLVRLAR